MRLALDDFQLFCQLLHELFGVQMAADTFCHLRHQFLHIINERLFPLILNRFLTENVEGQGADPLSLVLRAPALRLINKACASCYGLPFL